jgi:FkbM family methyltransferase
MYVNATFGLTLLSTGTYESERLMTTLFTKLVTEGMIVVDIGAHVGYYTLLAAKAVGDKGKVFCFEPESSNYALLLKNAEVNGYKNVTPVRKAVFSKTGKVNLFLGRYSGTHGLYPSVYSTSTLAVDAITLDEFFEDKDCPIDIIKMDIEGAEMAAVTGMAEILKMNHDLKIFTEFCPIGLQGAGSSAQEYWDKLVEHGFKFIYLINERKQKLEQTDLASVMKMCKSIGYVNLLCQRA